MTKASLKFIIIYLFLLIVLFPGIGNAKIEELPTMMVGQVTVRDMDNYIYYGGTTGNFAILNRSSATDYGFKTANSNTLPPDGFLLSNGCGTVPISAVGYCFVLGTGLRGADAQNQGKLMISDTYIISGGNIDQMIETPTLFYGRNVAMGDVFSQSSLGNLSFWGDNLHQGDTTGSDASWKLNGYAMNPNAQSSLSANGEENGAYQSKIDNLLGEATRFNAASWNGVNAINLQGSDLLGGLSDNSNGDKDSYPEGKIWSYDGGSVTITSDKTMYGVGTIVVDGNLTIADNISIKPAQGTQSRVGFIVTGNVNIGSNCDIRAAIFARGTMTVHSNTVLSGSFVASTFPGLNGQQNIQFYYDYTLDEIWPPGFRYLNMPKPAN